MEKINFFEPNTPSYEDSITCVLKIVEQPCQEAKPDKIFQDGKFVDYTGGYTFIQDIRTSVIFSNGSIAYNRSFQILPEEKKELFPAPGFFVKTQDGWEKISEEEYKEKTKHVKSSTSFSNS